MLRVAGRGLGVMLLQGPVPEEAENWAPGGWIEPGPSVGSLQARLPGRLGRARRWEEGSF